MTIEELKTALQQKIAESGPAPSEGSQSLTLTLPLFPGTPAISVTATAQANVGVLVFEANLNTVISVTLPLLSSLAGGADLARSLPAGLTLGNVVVSNLSFATTPAGNLISLSLGLLSTKEWRLVESLSVKDLFAQFTVSNPANAPSRSIECVVGGTLRIGNGELLLSASLPDFQLQGALAPDAKVQLKSALNSFMPTGLPVPPSLPDVQLTELNLRLAPREGSLALHAKAASGGKTGWAIIKHSDPTKDPLIAVQNVELFLQVLRNGANVTAAGALGGTVTLGNLTFFVSAEFSETLVLNGRYLPPETGATLTLASFLASLALPTELTAALGTQLKLREMDFTASPKLRTFQFHALVQNTWEIEITSETKFSLTSLLLNVDYAPQRPLGVLLEGKLQLTGLPEFTLTAARDAAGWKIQGRLDSLTVSQIAGLAVVKKLANNNTLPDTLPDSLKTLGFSGLVFGLETEKKSVSFQGRLKPWTVQFGEVGSLTINAALALQSELAGNGRTFDFGATGRVSFDGFSDNEFFQHFSMTAGYRHQTGKSKVIEFTLLLGELELKAEYTSGQSISFLISAKSGATAPTFGKLLTSMATLIDPTLDELELDEPWDLLLSELNKVTLPPVTFQLDFGQTKQRGKKFSVNVDLPSEINLGFLKFKKVALSYQKIADKKAQLTLDLQDAGGKSQLGNEPLDPFSPKAPANSPAPKFELRYLALGQHVTLSSLKGLHDIKSVMEALQGKVKALPPSERSKSPVTQTLQKALAAPELVFDANSNWLIAADFSAAGFLALKLIFNDPNVYGIRIELSGEKAKKFAGLQFEILYRRLSETLGVYHTELVLPDIMRFLEFGAVSVTLPIIVLDIYTNGDFKIDVGFPWNGNFERSCAVQILPFTGAGGFYFNKLSAETVADSSIRLPALNPAVGNFSPILAFGVGVRIGLGKSFNKGPLKAELSVVIQGILEGVIAWYNPLSKLPGGTYYKVQGALSIVGRVYGSVDFEVIRIDVEVVARVTIRFIVECYKPIVVTLQAEVSVNASLKILFVTIHFSFSLSLETSFEIPALESGAPPWQAALQAGSGERFTSLSVRRRPLPDQLSWDPIALFATPVTVDLFFHKAITRLDPNDNKLLFNGVALLMLQNSIAPDATGHRAHATSAATTDTNFDLLAQALLAWALFASQIQPTNQGEPDTVDLQNLVVSREDLLNLHQLLVNKPDLTFDKLAAFLKANFKFTIKLPEASETAPLSGSAFPMFPELRVLFGDFGPAVVQARKDLFVEYFVLLLRNLVQAAINAEPELSELRNIKLVVAKNLGKTGLLQKDKPIISATDPAALASQTPLLTKDDWAKIIQAQPKTAATKDETLNELLARLQTALGNSAKTVTADDLAVAIADNPDLLMVGQQLELDAAQGFPPSIRIPQGASLRGIAFNKIGISLADLLSKLNRDGSFNHLAGMASRFLLHGVRKATGSGNSSLSLYRETGQQFPLPTSLSTLEGRLTLANGMTPSAGLEFTSELVHPNNAALVTYTLENFGLPQNAKFPNPPTAEDLATDLDTGLYTRQPRKFANSQSFVWAYKAERKLRVIELAQPLQDFLQKKTDGTALKLTLPGGQPETVTQYLFATKITVTLQRIHATDGGDFLKDTFLIGGVNEAEQKLLAMLPANKTVQLLYAETDKPAKHLTNCLLVRTTVTDHTTNNTAAVATVQESAPFLALVRESGLTPTSGYYLRYLPQTGEPTADELVKTLFETGQANGLTATLTLLVTAQTAETFPTSAELAQPYHNTLILLDPAAPAALATGAQQAGPTLLAETTAAADRVLTFTGKPGMVGFRVTRDNDSLGPRLGKELKNLYQLLAYQITTPANVGSFKPANVTGIDSQAGVVSDDAAAGERWSYDPTGVPLGPTELETKEPAAPAQWVYERTIPAYRLFVPEDSPAQAELLPPRFNPYNGVREDNQIEVALRWRDLFGNEAPGATLAKSLPVQYTDPLIGIQEWPSATASYFFERSGESSLLKLELSFNIETFKDADDANETKAKPAREKAQAAQERYKRIWYQLKCADVRATLSTSVAKLSPAPEPTTPDLKAGLIGFVESAILYLAAIVNGAAVKPAAPFFASSENFSANAQIPNPDFSPQPQFVFPLTAQIEITRKEGLIHPALQSAIPQIGKVTTLLAPKIVFNGTESPLSALSQFASGFQTAFPGLRLATLRDEESDASSHLYAVQLAIGGEAAVQGLKFALRPLATNAVPLHFAPAPLTTNLISGTVKTYQYITDQQLPAVPTQDKRFDAVDLNVLARQLLVGVEELLSPEVAIRAMNSGTPEVQTAIRTSIDGLLQSKSQLVEALGLDVTTILQPPSTFSILDTDTALARATLANLSRVNLVEGYDVEEVILIPTNVTALPQAEFVVQGAPKLTYHPVVTQVKETKTGVVLTKPKFDISLSPATGMLTPGTDGYLAFRFDTKLPQQCEGRTLALDFRLSSLEYEIATGKLVHLTFIPLSAPTDQQNPPAPLSPENPYELPLAVPLRSYPPSPSLTSQKALADPDSVKNLAQVREWKYAFTYEHLDASQDTIEASVEYNLSSGKAATAANPNTGLSTGLAALFQALVNFTSLGPAILAELRAKLKAGAVDNIVATHFTNLAKLVREAAVAWNRPRAARAPSSSAATNAPHQYEINELPLAIETRNNQQKEVLTVIVQATSGSLPEIAVPGFSTPTKLPGETASEQTFEFSRDFQSQAGSPTPASAARTLAIPDLDIVGKQSAWAAVWLTRNKDLLATWQGALKTAFTGWEVSQAFRFQTPQVRFGNPLKPMLINHHEWDIATLSADNADNTSAKTLAAHLTSLFEVLLPASITQPFAIRVTCSYAFSLAETAGDDLVADIPVLLSPLTILRDTADAAKFKTDLVAHLAVGITAWKAQHHPEERNAEYIFSVSFFSGDAADHAPHLLLKIDDLRLRLTAIT